MIVCAVGWDRVRRTSLYHSRLFSIYFFLAVSSLYVFISPLNVPVCARSLVFVRSPCVETVALLSLWSHQQPRAVSYRHGIAVCVIFCVRIRDRKSTRLWISLARICTQDAHTGPPSYSAQTNETARLRDGACHLMACQFWRKKIHTEKSTEP